METFAQARLYR